MKKQDSFKVKIKNLSCFKQSAKILYTGSGENSIGNYKNDRALKQLDMNSSNWGDSFLTAKGSVWVNDGKTLPYAFNSNINVVIRYVQALTLFTTNLTTMVGESIDAFFIRVAQDMESQIGDKLLGGASPMGMEIYYASGGVLKMIPSQFQDFSGDYAVQDLQVTTTSFPTTMFGASTHPYGFVLTHEDGWNIDIMVRDLVGDYTALVNSLLDQSLYIVSIRKNSNNPEQVLESAVFKKYDSTGTTKQFADISVIDPYQAQSVIDYNVGVSVDGQVYMDVDVLAGEYLDLSFKYETSGILGYEQVSELEDLLRQQGIDTVNTEEEKELEEAFSNFSGFDSNNNEFTKIIMVGLIAYILINNK